VAEIVAKANDLSACPRRSPRSGASVYVEYAAPERTGEAIGRFLQAPLGNVAEFIIAIVAPRQEFPS
jgi:hypothetical protein